MELKSNIRIRSNLYIRSTDDGSFSFSDENYITQVKNRAALTALTKLAEKSCTELNLSDIQKKILGIQSFESVPAQNAEAESAAPDGGVIPAIPEITMPTVQPEKIDIGLDEFSEIDGGEVNSKIIESDLDAKIILDSVNYSEKIRIAAERVAFILKSNPKKRVLVLCGTDFAVEKIKRGVSDSLPNGLSIDMLDVFAAKYLSGIGENAAKITALSKNERLALFNDKMRTEDFAKYDFCLISDLDEFIAEHIKTVLKILVLLKCGFLLMSDKRRAILKYSTDSAFGRNVSKLRDVLPNNTERLSLGSVKHALSDDIDSIISAMTEGKPSDEACNALLTKMESVEISALSSADGETVVLCKDEGCAEYVSLVLHKNNIPHALLHGGKPAPVRQLADILWDSHERIIGRDNFIKRFIARCGGGESCAEEYFNKLCALTGYDPSEGLELAKLAEVISIGGIPLNLLNSSNERLAVSEIGSPCGKVFNNVYIADCGLNNSIDAKLLYLAAAGRTAPPAMLKLGGEQNAASNANDRRIHIDEDGKAAFGAGYPDDIDLSSFIGGSVGDAVRKQAYIAKNVKPGDSVTLRLNGNVFDIVHNNTVIGKTSAAFTENLAAEFEGQRYFDPIPEQLGGIYVTNVITVVSCREPSEYEDIISQQFRGHRFWYGVELSGFVKAE